MTQDIGHDSYSDKYYKSSIPIPWIKELISRNGTFKIDMADLHDYFGDIGEDPETVYRAIKKVLLTEGIVVSMDIDSYESLFLTFSFSDIRPPLKDKEKKVYLTNKEKEENFHKSLEDNKLFNEETKYLLCPECNRYSVEYSTSSYDKNDKKWWCNHCLNPIIYHDYHLDISDKDKYHIYKLWGAEALSIFTHKSLNKTIGFVASYFKGCCVSKKDKCLYFDFFKEKEDKISKSELMMKE